MNNDDEHITGLKKRQQISDTRKLVFGSVALASVAVVTCLMVGIYLFQAISYQGKVNGELAKTEKTLKDDADSIDGLIKNVNALRANKQLNLSNLKRENSTALQVVIDALPTEDDSTALSSSFQAQVFSSAGITIESLNVGNSDGSSSSTSSTDTTSSSTDGSASSSSSSTPTMPKAQTIPFKVSLIGSNVALLNNINLVERVIRPIDIAQLTIEGSDDKLQITVDGVTYYSPNVNFTTGTKEVPYEEK